MAAYTEITPNGYSYAQLRVGVVVRSPSGQEVYFQPGDATAEILEVIAALEEHLPMDRPLIADMALGEYFG